MDIKLSEHFTYKKLIKFTIPTIFMMIFTSIYGVVDGIFVSNCVGSDAFAAVNLIYPAIMIMGAVGFMIGTGGSALVSKTIGEGKKDEANRYFSMLIYLLIIFGTALTILGIFVIKPISVLLGAEGNILNNCIVYGITLTIGLVPFLLQNAFQSFLIASEKPTIGLLITVIAGVTNIVLDFVFIYLLKSLNIVDLGVFGAALATILSQTVGGIIPLLYFSRKNSSLLKLVKTKFESRVIFKSCVNGSSEMMTNLSMSLVNMLYNFQLMKYIGSDGVIAYGIIMYVGFIFVGTYVGYALGSAPIIGYHYGAENTDELKSLLKKSIKLIAVTSLVMTMLAEVSAKVLASIFVSYDTNLLDMATNAIRLFSISYIISGFNIFASSFFTALNNGLISALISFVRTMVFQVIMILSLPLVWGINGIWLAIVFAEALSLIVSFVLLVLNRKKYNYA